MTQAEQITALEALVAKLIAENEREREKLMMFTGMVESLVADALHREAYLVRRGEDGG